MPEPGDWLAVLAVSCEPVSAPNSLRTGKITGNFPNLAIKLDFSRPMKEVIQQLAPKFPTQDNREIIRRIWGLP
jgi:hypothetical protein